ncbi:MAG TPA: HAD family phosphatase [Anaerolineae bacterium]|nr:HAD family phosphatase [Anaerolineae bacterium]
MPEKEPTYDLIAIDLDGTLLDSKKFFSKDALTTINKVRDKGIRIIIVTGRNKQTLKRIFQKLDYRDFFIGSGGAYIANPDSGEVLEMQTLRTEDTLRIIRLCRKFHLLLFLDHPDWMRAEKTNKRFRLYKQTHGYQWEIVNDLTATLKDPPTKAVLIGPQAHLNTIKEILDGENRLLNISPASDYSLDITYTGATKGNALKKLLSYLEIAVERTAAIGDHLNDLDMFQVVKTAVAMGNSPKEVQQAADIIAPCNDKGGVAWALNKLVLNN